MKLFFSNQSAKISCLNSPTSRLTWRRCFLPVFKANASQVSPEYDFFSDDDTSNEDFSGSSVITQCSVEALYKLGKEYQDVTNLAKTFERRRCNHREPVEEHLCIKDVVGE